MKAISIQQPWAWAILHAGKDVENRTWYTGYRGVIAIHAPAARQLRHRWPRGAPKPPAELDYSAIVGVAELVDVVEKSDSPWFGGPFGFVLANPRPLSWPVQCKGNLMLWTVPPPLARAVEMQLNPPRTFMLTWNPRQRRPADLRYALARLAEGRSCHDRWSTGKRKDVPVGSRVFLVRQGVPPRGVVASGYTQGEPERTDESHSRYCSIAWTAAFDADQGDALTVTALRKNPILDKVPWGIAGGGREFSAEQARELERLWRGLLSQRRLTETHPDA